MKLLIFATVGEQAFMLSFKAPSLSLFSSDVQPFILLTIGVLIS
jgi:hypothetical protein